MAGTLFVVATPIGNLEDITARAVRVLREVAVIAAEDTRRTAHLLARYGITTRTTSLHEHNERGKGAQLLARLQAGEHVALVSDAGTPAISDPGRHLVADAFRLGIRVEPIPGPSAVVAALSVAGMFADEFTFMGFPPIKSRDRSAWFERLRAVGRTVVFYEAPHRIRRTLAELAACVGDVEVALCRELTKTHEELVKGPISVVLDRLVEPIGEFVVVTELGHKTDSLEPEKPGDAQLSIEFGYMTDNLGATRRQAISTLSKRYRLTSKDVYRRLESVKKSGG